MRLAALILILALCGCGTSEQITLSALERCVNEIEADEGCLGLGYATSGSHWIDVTVRKGDSASKTRIDAIARHYGFKVNKFLEATPEEIAAVDRENWRYSADGRTAWSPDCLRWRWDETRGWVATTYDERECPFENER